MEAFQYATTDAYGQVTGDEDALYAHAARISAAIRRRPGAAHRRPRRRSSPRLAAMFPEAQRTYDHSPSTRPAGTVTTTPAPRVPAAPDLAARHPHDRRQHVRAEAVDPAPTDDGALPRQSRARSPGPAAPPTT